MKTIRVSDKLHQYLKDQGSKGESFETILWRLIRGEKHEKSS